MRNLRNVRFGRWRHKHITGVAWDPEKDEVLCTIGPTAHNHNVQLVRVLEDERISHSTVASWDAPSPSPDLPADNILSLQYLGGTSTTCLVLEGGDLITVHQDLSGASATQVEIVGTIDAGIAAARWSPDEELLVIVTKDNNVVFMGRSFDPVVEVAMNTGDLAASKHVSVGWGKKETQFQGRGAKAMRDPTIPEKVDEGVASSQEDGKTTISWRGDGAFVAINSLIGDTRRAIRVYSREGELDSVSEPVDGLESTVSWRPAGNLISSIRRRQDQIDVVFFERNGLRHGEFTLRSPDRHVSSCENIRLEWNADSSVLAVMLGDMIQLWTTGNYHWYLKQELPVDPSYFCLSWHPEKALRFAAASSTGVVLAEQIFHSARGSCRPPSDFGAVAVIDGETVKLTPLRNANVPPPMSLFDLKAEASVIDVTFGPKNGTIAILHHKGVDVYEWPLNNRRPGVPRRFLQVPFETANIPEYHTALRICCSGDGQFRCMNYQDDLGHVQLVVRADVRDTHMTVLNDSHQLLVATAMYEGSDSVEGYGQDHYGKLYKLSLSENELLPVRFPNQLPWFEIAKMDGAVTAFGLSRSGHLYANSRLLARNCTSFTVTPSHLIFTTNNHFVKYVHLVTDLEDLEIPGDDPEKDERCRSVERGSRLVTAIPTNMSIVLQMPRGNIETVFPRAMVVAGIRELIEEKNYARAFAYCRTQRVDMNILYDHQPAQFISHVALFLHQLRDIAYIDLFLSSLREEDVTQTMYKDTKKRTRSDDVALPEITRSPSGSNKINLVCDAMLRGLMPLKATHLQNIITAHVCKSPPALDDGLQLVAELMLEDEKVAEKAVEHICFLVDVNRLYETALGLYNLDLALLVAQQSQRDPREYLPFIQRLHNLSELRRRYEIDDHLSRRLKALDSLREIDSFDELCSYTTRYNLYNYSLKLYRYDATRHATLTALFAEHLERTSSFREAGLAYESLENYTRATSCYRQAGSSCWQECLFTAHLQSPPSSAESLVELASTLADALWESREYEAAGIVHLEYLSNVEQAIKCFCKGYHFSHAMRLAQRHEHTNPGLMERNVDVGLTDSLASTTEFLADCKAQLASQAPRILALRQKAAEDPLAFYEGERPSGIDGEIPDDVSVAPSSRMSTSASLFTRYTGKGAASVGTAGTGVSRATSKNRRREEKKRARGRKGTVYEEEYLVNSLRRLVERVDGTKSEVENLVFALARRKMAERARAVETLMAEVVEACEMAVAEVFGPKPVDEAQARGSVDGNDQVWKATGGDAVLQDFVETRAKVQEPPRVSPMRKLTLLGS